MSGESDTNISDLGPLQIEVSPKIDTDGAIIYLEGYEDVVSDIYPNIPQDTLNGIEQDISYRVNHILYVIFIHNPTRKGKNTSKISALLFWRHLVAKIEEFVLL